MVTHSGMTSVMGGIEKMVKVTDALPAFPFQVGQLPSNRLEVLEEEAVNTLRARITLILAEDGWSSRRPAASYWTKNSEPW
jgi:hypothetical protein